MRTNIRLFAILLLSLVTGCLYADNLYIEEVNVFSGKTVQVGISLLNASSKYTAIQFDMILPDGISMAKDELGELKASLNVNGGDHRFRVTEVTTNKYRFLIYSMTNSELVVSDSPLILFTIETVGGINYDSKTGSIKDALLVQENGKSNVLKDTSFSVTVKEIPVVTIVANSYERPYGDANPQFDFKTEGGELNGTPEITCEADAKSPIGTYDIIVRQGSVSNEKVTYVNGVLTITKAPLTVKVEDATREQYLENPEFVIAYTGWKVGDDESVLTKKPTATTTATKDSPVGTYDIVLSGGDAQNYELSYQNGVLTITESTGIATISAKNPVDIYTLQGHKVRTKAMTAEGLPKGVYIVNGRKVVVK